MSSIEDFRPLAYAIARDFFLPGGDLDDLRQEAMIGVWKGLRDYRPDGGMALRNFVALCVKRQLITAVKTSTRLKAQPLNVATSLDAPAHGEEEDLTVGGLLPAPGADPVEVLADREEALRLLTAVRCELTPLERRALIGLANGQSYNEISAEVGDTGNSFWPDGRPRAKRVENAVIRARQKLGLVPPTAAALAA